jgi:basic membrane protein A and related proteins
MGQYLNGIAAGHATKTKKIGFVAAKPIPQVMLNINSFLLGARAVDPTITCQVIFTGEWSLAVKEAEATNALADAGLRRHHLPCRWPQGRHGNRRRSWHAFLCGYHANQSGAGTREVPDRGRMELGGRLYRHGQPCRRRHDRQLRARRHCRNFIKMSPLGPPCPTPRAPSSRRPRPRS